MRGRERERERERGRERDGGWREGEAQCLEDLLCAPGVLSQSVLFVGFFFFNGNNLTCARLASLDTFCHSSRDFL